MASKWPYKRVEEIAIKVAMGPFGSSIKVETFKESGIPIISGQHLHESELTDSDFNFITEAHADRLKNSNVQRGDVIFTHAGSIGQVSFIPENSKYERYIISQRQFYLRCDTKIILPEFITYFFKSQEGQHKLLANANQVGVPSIARPSSYLKIIEVPVPPIDEQLLIVKKIQNIDRKIRLNRRTNQTLEAIAQAIFKSWFVDFDPVKAKIAALEQGEDPLRAAMRTISGKTDDELDQLPREQYDELAETAGLFPSAMEKSEIGNIPTGWPLCQIKDIMELQYGKALKSTERIFGTIPVYGSGGIIGYHNQPLIQNSSIIIGRKGTVGSLYWEDNPFYPIDTTFYVKSKSFPLSVCYYALQTLGLERMNTDAAIPGLNRDNVYRLAVIAPPENILGKFDKLASSIKKTIRQEKKQIKTLASIRDEIMPKLLQSEFGTSKTNTAQD
jgi:restriction modification system, type I